MFIKMPFTFFSIRFGMTVALLVATMFVSGLTTRRLPDSLAVSLDRFDSEIDGWKKQADHTLSAGVIKALNPTSYLSRTYRNGSTDADLLIVFYEQQRAGESMHSPKHCLPGSGWEIWKHGSATVPINGQQFQINKYSIQNQGTRMLMCYWYQSRTRVFASEYMGKILLARDTLLTGRTAGSIVRILLPDVPGSEQQSIGFASRLIPLVQRSFGSEGPLEAR
jgi:EpsI family protein